MRVYDHYRFRFSAWEQGTPGHPVDPPQLAGDDSWTDDYFTEGHLKELDRLRFAGA
jgi:hypothetical protein